MAFTYIWIMYGQFHDIQALRKQIAEYRALHVPDTHLGYVPTIYTSYTAFSEKSVLSDPGIMRY